jgi:hypothetical protein
MKLAIVLFVLVVVALVAFVALAGTLFNNLTGNLSNGDAFGGDCAFLSDADAKTVFGGNADAFDLSGLADASIGLIIDKRVLPNAPDCWVTEGDKAYIARIALYQGSDASSVFTAEFNASLPSSQDQGGGVTIENPGYFGGEVSLAGDEAFCTDLSAAIMAGVLVRQGDRVVYVSVGSANENQPADASALCSFALEVAEFMLR